MTEEVTIAMNKLITLRTLQRYRPMEMLGMFLTFFGALMGITLMNKGKSERLETHEKILIVICVPICVIGLFLMNP